MNRRKIHAEILSYGQYEKWDRSSSELPQLITITERVEAEIDVEFGYIVRLIGGKGKKIAFRIDHPPFTKDDGTIEPPFDGEFFIPTNDYKFYLGDTIWEPVYNKLGQWRMSVFYRDELLAEKSILLYQDKSFDLDW